MVMTAGWALAMMNRATLHNWCALPRHNQFHTSVFAFTHGAQLTCACPGHRFRNVHRHGQRVV